MRTVPFTLLLLCTVHRINSYGQPGSCDYFFDTGTGTSDRVRSLALTTDGRIYVGGDFTTFDVTAAPYLVRLFPDGSRDDAFNVAADLNGPVHGLAIQPDDRLVVVGDFNQYDGAPAPRIMRLNSDGSRDLTFQAAEGADSVITCVDLAADGSIYIGGHFTTVDGSIRQRVARLLSNGTLDPDFLATGIGPNRPVYTLLPISDGGVLIGGDFTSIGAETCGRIAMLESDGTVSTSFNAQPGADSTVWCLERTLAGGFIVGGIFHQLNGSATTRIACLQADGSPDPTFTSTESPNSAVLAITCLPDGKYVIGGMFTSVGPSPRNRLARLLPDGALDQGFITGTGIAGFITPVQVRDIALDAEGRLLVCGVFHAYNIYIAPGLVRIFNTGGIGMPGSDGGIPESFAYRADGVLLPPGNSPFTFTVFDALGRALHNSSACVGHTPISFGTSLNQGCYLITAHDEKVQQTFRVVIP